MAAKFRRSWSMTHSRLRKRSATPAVCPKEPWPICAKKICHRPNILGRICRHWTINRATCRIWMWKFGPAIRSVWIRIIRTIRFRTWTKDSKSGSLARRISKNSYYRARRRSQSLENWWFLTLFPRRNPFIRSLRCQRLTNKLSPNSIICLCQIRIAKSAFSWTTLSRWRHIFKVGWRPLTRSKPKRRRKSSRKRNESLRWAGPWNPSRRRRNGSGPFPIWTIPIPIISSTIRNWAQWLLQVRQTNQVAPRASSSICVPNQG